MGEPDYWHSPRAKRAYNGCAPEGGCLSLYNVHARVAELADAQDLKSCCSDTVKCTLCQGHYDFSFSDFYFIFVCCVEASK